MGFLAVFYEKGNLYEKEPQIFLNLDANFFKGPDGKRTMIKIIYPSEKSMIRMPTPKEALRLMGFNDNDYKILAANKISDTQIYRMAGNSIAVPVVEGIVKKLFC